MSTEIAKEILRQLGGARFVVMTGSKNFIGGEQTLSFKVGKNPKGVTHVRITLTAMDDYVCEFLKIRASKIKPVAYAEGIYCDMLQSTFTEKTGLYTKL